MIWHPKDEHETIGTLFGFQEATPEPDPAQDCVGWARPGVYGSVKGSAHVCILCSPERPGAAHRPILRMQLAARESCTRCGTPLEGVQPGPKKSKKRD